MRRLLRALRAVGLSATLVATVVACTASVPGAPGSAAVFTPADKQGFGTARSERSPVWFTLGRTGMTEVFYPDLSTPAVRELQLIVSDGTGTPQRLQDVEVRTEQSDQGSLTLRQSATGRGWSATLTYVTDPQRATVLAEVNLRSLTGRPLRAFTYYDPSLTREGNDDTAATVGDALVASDGSAASALVADPSFTATSNGYLATSDGWTDLAADGTLDWHYPQAGPGNVVQTGQLPIDGLAGQHATLALGFGAHRDEALATARATLRQGFSPTATSYANGWRNYLQGLRLPAAVHNDPRLYTTSLMVLASTEDKHHPGAFIASPSMPWAFGFNRTLAKEFGSYALVWPRDLYQIASAMLAAGDRAAADRALDYMLGVQQRPDGHLPQNTRVDGTPYWTSVQLDETAAPMLLAGLLGRTDIPTLDHLRRAAEFLVNYRKDGNTAPFSEQERWENHSGYSPATISSAIAGLVCLADLLTRTGDTAGAARYLTVADHWQSTIDNWTATNTGPLSDRPYYLRLTKDGQPDHATTYNLGDNNPGPIDQRAVVDPSFLELVRLGVKPATDPVIRNTLAAIDQQLATTTPAGRFWHRFTNDGYGERADGGPWNINQLTPQRTFGRLWPILAGERGEYDLLGGDRLSATQALNAITATAGSAGMLPEQVWDDRPPAPDHAHPGTATTSATPLAWTHAQYIRLAWSIDAGHPVEQPTVVACRYTATC
ncbi:MAG: glucoamylase [Pseudonocardiales bacterium]|nr:glucoamylase [Pseudonocardiales bacterium]